MIKLNGLDKIRIAIFISGKGSNLKNLIKFSIKKKSMFKVKFIVSDNQKSKGLRYAKQFKIKKKFIDYKDIKNSEKQIINLLKKEKIRIICLAGFMKILSKNFVKKFDGFILNIHPSLLPKYKGLNTHAKAINNRDKYSGCTVHFVSTKLDSGKIILQKRIKILKKDNPKSLAKRILKEEHILYPKALIKVASNL